MLDEPRRARIAAAVLESPPAVLAKPATEEELQAFEVAFGPLPPTYRWFLSECGGGVVGRERLDDIRKLWRSQAKYEREFGPPAGWSMERVLIIGWDGAGNPIALHKTSGRVMVEDHTFGGVHELAPTFLDYLERLLFPTT